MSVNGIMGALTLVATVVQRMFKNQKTDSLVSFTKATRVEPIVMIDRRLAHLQYLTDVMQSLSSIFSGYYLQAVAVMTHVDSINVLRALDALNPNRDVGDAAATHLVDYVSRPRNRMSHESYQASLPKAEPANMSLENFALSNAIAFEDNFKVSFEDGGRYDYAVQKNKDAQGQYSNKKLEETVDAALSQKSVDKSGNEITVRRNVDVSDNLKMLNEAVSLSVGKMLSVTIGSGDRAATFPLMVRMIATFVDGPILTHILGDNSRNLSMKERFHSWRSGQIGFWRDLVMCQDLIDEHKDALMKDNSGTYSEILARRRNNNISSALTETPSIGTASNLMVVSKQTIKELEREIGGSFDRYETRQKVFKSTYLMVVAVVDHERELVDFYHRGIKLSSRLSVRELKVSNKGSGPDVAEILKAYMLGQAPSL